MDYESFKEKFVEDVKDRLYEQGAEVDLSIHTVNKLNESYEAITVTPEGSNIGVNIGIDKFYGAVEDGRPYDEVVDKAVDVINNGINQRPDFDIESLSDYSQMKEKLAMEVVSAEANKEMLETNETFSIDTTDWKKSMLKTQKKTLPAHDSTGSYSQRTLSESACFLGTFEISKDYMRKSVKLYYGSNRNFRFPEKLEFKLFLV